MFTSNLSPVVCQYNFVQDVKISKISIHKNFDIFVKKTLVCLILWTLEDIKKSLTNDCDSVSNWAQSFLFLSFPFQVAEWLGNSRSRAIFYK